MAAMPEREFLVSGERAALGLLRREHLPKLAVWFNELESYAFNEQAMCAYERTGFREIGRRRDCVLALGRRWDSVLMDATAEGFESPVLGRLQP
jgi:hypothetical protein